MQISSSTGFFIESPQPSVLKEVAKRHASSNLVLKRQAGDAVSRQAVARLARQVQGQRLIVPLVATSPLAMQREAEDLSLQSENIYVQIPIMTAGQTNYRLIDTLLSEGVAVAVTGLASRRMVDCLLTGLPCEAPLILMMEPAAAYYDLVVSAAIAKIFPQVQLVLRAANVEEAIAALPLRLDGVVLPADLFGLYRQLAMRPAGSACRLADRRVNAQVK